MGAVWVQAFPNHETRLGIQVCRRESFDPDRNIEITGDLLVNKVELI